MSPVQAQLSARVHASGFTNPVAFVQDPADRGIQFVVQQNGHIRVVRNGAVLPADFLDLSRRDGWRVASADCLDSRFAPDVGGDRFFVNFTESLGRHRRRAIPADRRALSSQIPHRASTFDGAAPAAPASIAQPFANHNGGHLAFGPDGYLYIGLGDGGSGNDPDHRAQNPSELLGKMLRIDVGVPDTHPTGYQIPADNPFVSGGPAAACRRSGASGCGIRGAIRSTIRRLGGTGALVIGDVGQGRFEEIDYEPRGRGGRNYGWRNREGAHDNITITPPAFLPLVDPIFEYDRSLGPVGHRRIRLSRPRARRRQPGPVFLRRFRVRAGCGRLRWRSIPRPARRRPRT